MVEKCAKDEPLEWTIMVLLNVLTLYIITICLCFLVVEDNLQVYRFESSAQRWTSSNV
jgi:hypothetical protein